MTTAAGAPPVRFDPHLVEEVVLQAAEAANSSERDRYRRERDATYEIEEPDIRETRFRELDARWFKRFGLAERLLNLLREHATLGSGVSCCYVLPAASRKDEGADLHRAKGEPSESARPVLVIRLLPATFLDADRLTLLLQHELLHVTDMLDPEFGYDPFLPEMNNGPVFQRLVQDRYRVLWNTTIDGRLATAGKLPLHLAERRRREFLVTFRMLGDVAERHFQHFFQIVQPKHGELVSFAVQLGFHESNSRQCPLCQLPTPQLRPIGAGLEARIVDAIRADFPRWAEEDGLCLQCADLYDTRAAG